MNQRCRMCLMNRRLNDNGLCVHCERLVQAYEQDDDK